MTKWRRGIPGDNKQYLASFKNRLGKRRTIKAFHARKNTIESQNEEESDDEYSEVDDCYYLVEGWYEVVENWPDFHSISVFEGEVTHYTSLPSPPED
ncbi:MAG: hypothetical protein BMS9Abin31_0139 [Gammaproteobacteria bacterium]|nr:MAG: hypothetical protein BMS9Abin31_0139 [Gammaproteobacteria bacterium]